MNTNEKLNSIINKLVSSSDPDEVKSLYRQWSETYDHDLEQFGYVAPTIACEIFANRISTSSEPILDAGCGTGLVGVLLTQLGYTNLHGSDFSPDMLTKAKTTGCYSKLNLTDFTLPFSESDNVYEAIISVGVYSKRFNEYFIDEVCRILKPGGSFLFTCREQYYEEVAEKIKQLHSTNLIRYSEFQLDHYMKAQGAMAYYVLIQKSYSGMSENTDPR